VTGVQTCALPIFGPWVQLVDPVVGPEWLLLLGLAQNVGFTLFWSGVGFYASAPRSQPPPPPVQLRVGPGSLAGTF